MIKWLICRLWGHKTVVKAYTGETYVATNMLGDPHVGKYYLWKRFDFCLWCGTNVKEENL